MPSYNLRFIVFIGLLLCCHTAAWAGQIAFIENVGQWHSKVAYKVDIPSGVLFLEKHGFTYSLVERGEHNHTHIGHSHQPSAIRSHAFKMTFVGAKAKTTTHGKEQTSNYYNYFIGNDPSKWKRKVHGYGEVNYTSLYNGIDLKIYAHNGGLKYDLIVAPNANTNSIVMNYDGADEIEILKNGDLKVSTSIIDVLEKSPVAFQVIDGVRKEIPCQFSLEGNRVSFAFPEGYDQSQQLIIDPELVFASYSGSTADNFGSSATYDNAGHLYGGGTTFGAGYPTTIGAYTQTAEGNTDISISKFSPDGSSLIYSTFIGGNASEAVHSLIVDNNNDLCILGTSASPNYPTSANCFQPVQNAGPAVNWFLGYGYGVTFAGGCDMVISKLSADGSSLLASTYMGGTGNDGINPNTILYYNYGDPFRGEINIDQANNIYVASSTESTDFPTTPGAAQATNTGGRDGVVFKLNPNLTNLVWSTYIGGSDTDNAYSIQLSPNGECVVGGGTLSSNFPTTAGALNPNAGGLGDGWVAKISANGTAIVASTYIGTNKYDQTYFVQVDSDGNIFLLGQSLGFIPKIPTSVYNNPNSGQFIQKLDNSLSNLLVSTTIGTSSGAVDFSPTAFLVSNCHQIFLSGWGGETNSQIGNATQSTTNGLPVTPDAFQATTDGSDFYLMMLERDAQSLIYGTFFGGTSEEHVDGGTSRFDKNGVVYQAVCAGCGNSNDFPTTTGAWSNTNNSSNCNLGVFKFDLNKLISAPDFNVLLENCEYPLEVEFLNNSTGANAYNWDFGDTETSTDFEGSHFYNEPGTYEITLIARDSANCLAPDTASVEFDIPVPPIIAAFGTDTICVQDTVPIWVEGDGIVSYTWSPAWTLETADSTEVNALPTETTTYLVTATDSLGCQVTDTVTVYVSAAPTTNAGEDAYLQIGVPGYLQAEVSPGSTITWTPPDGLSCTDCPNPIADPKGTTTYYVEVTDEFGCSVSDSVIVYAYPTIYVPNAFTPGGNVDNPIFYAYGQGIAFFEMNIYTRWGQLIFHSDHISKGWDGTTNGIEAQTGVYVWTLKYSTDVNPNTFEQQIGHVTLLRNHF